MSMTKSLHAYLLAAVTKGSIDHRVRARHSVDGGVAFYIHPADRDGYTLDFEVRGNRLVSLPKVALAPAPDAPLALPVYQCHKRVTALKIGGIIPGAEDTVMDGGSWTIIPADERYPEIEVSHEFVTKHKPEAGGYYVIYEDGYTSFSPAAAFESGYSLEDARIPLMVVHDHGLAGDDPLAMGWPYVSDALDGKALPAVVSELLYGLCDGTARVVPTMVVESDTATGLVIGMGSVLNIDGMPVITTHETVVSIHPDNMAKVLAKTSDPLVVG